jgi:autotransporter adhesin
MLERNAAITIGTGGLISNGISSVTIGGGSANHTYGAESTIAGGMSNEAKAWGAAIGGGHSNNANTVNATTVNGDTITAGDTVTINSNGIDMGGTKITNLKDGDINANSTDAVTGKQLFNTNRSIEKLGNRVDKVGAGAAALAALHPLDFDPDAKWDFAAGYGNYSGENAVALGAYYRPNEDLMFSIGSTMGNGENMLNAGVSVKVGGMKGVSKSRVAIGKEVLELKQVVAKQDAQIQKLTAMLNGFAGTNANVDTTKLFPDVPSNHWAYEAVAAMSRSGLVEGYPKSYKPIMTSSRY